MSELPQAMRAVVLDAYHADLREAVRRLKVLSRPLPQPDRGQVLVQVEAAPCNPSDLLLLEGKYQAIKTLPTVPGWEGAGTVVASGGGLLGGWLKGKRVACALQGDRDGTWAQYCVADAADCVPLRKEVGLDQAASLIINPFTAIGLIETARREGHRAAVHTAAASQLGRMLLRLANDEHYPLICIVRRAAQVELLKSLGAEHVLDSSQEDFVTQLTVLCDQLHATVAFEAIAGEMTGTVLNALQPSACVYVYGALSEQPCGNIDPINLIYYNKQLRGFFLGEWLHRRGRLRAFQTARRAQQLVIDGRTKSTIQRELGFDDLADGLLQYLDHMTEGKVLIRPHLA